MKNLKREAAAAEELYLNRMNQKLKIKVQSI